MKWRWDQGRLPYFRYENICSMSKVLNSLDGIDLSTGGDALRQPLEQGTGLPFAPLHYKVWRNYSRVFQCAMLATSIDNRMIVSELCKNLASSSPFSPDEYLNFIFTHFQYPYPAFEGYNAAQQSIFPFVTIIKFLISREGEPITLNDIFTYIIGNNCTGLESVAQYKELPKKHRTPIGDELRQVREMLVFMSQCSFIRWINNQLFIDTTDYENVLSATTPFLYSNREQLPAQEFLRLTSLSNYIILPNFDVELRDRGLSELYVTEGRKSFISHRKIERSPIIRERYFHIHPTLECDACGIKPDQTYPWLKNTNILELHHLLPLSSTLNVNGTTTTMDDLKPLCPNCHRSVHIFYKNKLDEMDLMDFSSKRMAMDVYNMAKNNIVR